MNIVKQTLKQASLSKNLEIKMWRNFTALDNKYVGNKSHIYISDPDRRGQRITPGSGKIRIRNTYTHITRRETMRPTWGKDNPWSGFTRQHWNTPEKSGSSNKSVVKSVFKRQKCIYCCGIQIRSDPYFFWLLWIRIRTGTL